MTERLFVSVDLPDAFVDEIRAIQETLTPASGIRPTDPGQVHVTLAFLGETPEDRVPAVRDAVESGVDRADLGPFDVEYRDLGVFPSEDYISVVWLGVGDGTEPLTRLHHSVVGALEDAGVSVDTHETFTPHATIARMDHGGGKEHVQQVVRTSAPELGADRVDDVRLKRSLLGSDGPTYETVESFPLA
jgi:2'-5' RNA ligase